MLTVMLHPSAAVTEKVKVDVMHVVPVSFAQREREDSSPLMKLGVVPPRAPKPPAPGRDGPALHDYMVSERTHGAVPLELFRTGEAEGRAARSRSRVQARGKVSARPPPDSGSMKTGDESYFRGAVPMH
jgi:hypothetical protein